MLIFNNNYVSSNSKQFSFLNVDLSLHTYGWFSCVALYADSYASTLLICQVHIAYVGFPKDNIHLVAFDEPQYLFFGSTITTLGQPARNLHNYSDQPLYIIILPTFRQNLLLYYA